MDNHELRISRLEGWQDKYDIESEKRIRETITMSTTIESIKDLMSKQEKRLEKQDDKLDNLSLQMNKIIIAVLTTIVLLLVKLVLDLTILKSHGN
jgi:plasmid maintenance system killer protein